MANYKLIQGHTSRGGAKNLWLLFDESGDLLRLPDGTMMGMFSSPYGLEPTDIARYLIRFVEMARR